MTRPRTFTSDDGGLSEAQARVTAQEAKLAGMHEDDSQKRHERRVLSSMKRTVATIETNKLASADIDPPCGKRAKRRT